MDEICIVAIPKFFLELDMCLERDVIVKNNFFTHISITNAFIS